MPENLRESDLPVSFTVLVNGSPVSDAVEVISITVDQEINRIASASVRIADGGSFGLENDPFANSEGSDFIPGNEIEIQLGYGDSQNTVFKGIMVSQRLGVKRNSSFLHITCKDKALTLTKTRSNTVLSDASDDDLFKQIASKAGLAINSESVPVYKYPIVQYNCSDWDYMVIRAEVNGLFVSTDNNTIQVRKYGLSGSPSFALLADLVAIEVDLDLNGENLYPGFKFTSWDPSAQQSVEVSATMSDPSALGNIKAEKMAGDLGMPTLQKFSSAPLSEEELTSLSESWTDRSALSKIQGRIKIPGTSEIKAGDLVELKNFGARFDGNAFVSKVEHEMTEGDWITTLYIGLYSRWHSSLPEVEDHDAIGLLPAVKGTHLATVKQINEDPDGESRVLIELSSFQNSAKSNQFWARISFNYAGKETGFFFFPEVGDEVLVTFLNGDPRFPVITGSLYSSANPPKFTPDAENTTKSIHSKSGIAFIFNDKDKVLTVETPGGNKLVLDDKEKQISVKDCNSNEMVMGKDGIVISSPKDITLDAKGNINLKAASNIGLQATADLKLNGINVKLEAQATLKASGAASAEFSASGQTTVKGAMVMIN